ncbi:MAG: hypothetical protein JWL82_9 [Parcubacteria group bacterium]|nr:hypothetical protein [Parcubacteria group bacterium]
MSLRKKTSRQRYGSHTAHSPYHEYVYFAASPAPCLEAFFRDLSKHGLRSLLLILLLGSALSAHAATVTFDPQEQVVGLRSPFKVGMLLTTTERVNTVHIELVLPEGITPVDLSDGDSIINFWISNPQYNEATHVLSFEGIIPGGFSGEQGRLLVLTLQAAHPGTIVIRVNPKTSVLYRNTPDAAEEPLIATPLTLRVSSTKDNVLNELADTSAPEEFTPLISRSPDTYGGNWILSFATQDKGSGVASYEVAERAPGLPFFIASDWKTADSPYVLTDQRLTSTVIVRATDKKGNARIETVSPVYPLPWYANLWVSYILIAGALLLILLGYVFIHANKRASAPLR